jgi:hypothetical protein
VTCLQGIIFVPCLFPVMHTIHLICVHSRREMGAYVRSGAAFGHKQTFVRLAILQCVTIDELATLDDMHNVSRIGNIFCRVAFDDE